MDQELYAIIDEFRTKCIEHYNVKTKDLNLPDEDYIKFEAWMLSRPPELFFIALHVLVDLPYVIMLLAKKKVLLENLRKEIQETHMDPKSPFYFEGKKHGDGEYVTAIKKKFTELAKPYFKEC